MTYKRRNNEYEKMIKLFSSYFTMALKHAANDGWLNAYEHHVSIFHGSSF